MDDTPSCGRRYNIGNPQAGAAALLVDELDELDDLEEPDEESEDEELEEDPFGDVDDELPDESEEDDEEGAPFVSALLLDLWPWESERLSVR